MAASQFAVADATQVGSVRRGATELAEQLGFDETDVARVALVATEMASNLVKHTEGGQILLRTSNDRRAVELVAVDRGRGIANVASALRDGVSTRGTQGTGLGAIARVATRFDLYSRPGEGTVIFAAVASAPAGPSGFDVGGVCAPFPGEEVSGDRFEVDDRDGRVLALVTDGLGHGPMAAAASARAAEIFAAGSSLAPVDLMQRLHEGMRATRGAAAALAEIDARRGMVRYCGVGNIAATIVTGGIDAQPGLASRYPRPRRAPHRRVPVSLVRRGDVGPALRRIDGALDAGALPRARRACGGTRRGRAVSRFPPSTGRRDRPRATGEDVSAPLLSIRLRYDEDVVLARQRAGQVAAALGFDGQGQTRIATAVSEIARNALRYAREGKVEFQVEGVTPPQVLSVVVSDEGPGVSDLPAVLEGRYRSETGMGLGIIGARRLMDRFTIDSGPGRGTTVAMHKIVPRGTPLLGRDALTMLSDRLERGAPRSAAEEVQQQNQELLRALEELTRRQDEIAAINRELEDTNRGVVALYAELNDRADHLRRADEIKTRFISNMSHEFRTPVNSIQALARLLLDRADGELTPEQERQVLFIRQSADALAELVNDLLDLAKIEAGKTTVQPNHFEVGELFGALRGMLRPLLVGDAVSLVFDEPDGIPTIFSDEAKVSQILRNFVSNALKFTAHGEVRVSAEATAGGAVVFRVSDTGIGIAEDDLERIFHEFTQVDSPVQRRVKGTGLGLPLCRRLAELLGGSVAVESRVGVGSTFIASIPMVYATKAGESAPSWQLEPTRTPILVVEDSPETILVYEKYLAGSGFQVLPAYTVREAREALLAVRPRAVVLDVALRGEDTWELLMEIKRRDDTRDVPVLVVTNLEDERKAIALGADAYCRKPIERRRLVHLLTRLTAPHALRRILIVDDEEISRYVLRQHLMRPEHVIWEAENADEALRVAREERPDVVCLDLRMPGDDGHEVLRRLQSDPETREIPVVIVTSQTLDDEARRTLAPAVGLLAKEGISRESALATIEAAMRGERRI